MVKFLFAAFCIPLFAISQSIKEVQFNNALSWTQILEKAKEENKSIFMDVYASWCGPCKLMDRDIYTNDTIGDFMNNKFISVRVQMDSTANDNSAVRSWYATAKQINLQYKIQGFPSFLFFSPDGELVNRDIGFKDVSSFYHLAEFSADPERRNFAREISEYRKGIKSYHSLGTLINSVRNLQGDYALADSMALDYKTNYLDKLSAGEICTRDNIEFIKEYPQLVRSGDKIFDLFYDSLRLVDSICHYQGLARNLVILVITREEIEEKLWNSTKPLTKHPNWNEIFRNISNKYDSNYAKSILPDQEKLFYLRTGNWDEFVRITNNQIKGRRLKHADSGTSLFEQDYWKLNEDAWNLFLGCDNKRFLNDGLGWINLAIQLCLPDTLIQCLDTKANLLYKLGRINEGIFLEDRAVKIAINSEKQANLPEGSVSGEYMDILSKMKRGWPTWQVR